MDSQFTHMDSRGNAVMVDVSGKAVTERRAVAVGRIRMSDECFAAVQKGAVKKGDVLGVAQIAGIMGAKKTSELIPPVPHPEPRELRRRVRHAGRGKGDRSYLHGEVRGQDGSRDGGAHGGFDSPPRGVRHVARPSISGWRSPGIHLVEKEGGKSGDFRYDGGLR